MRDKKTTLSADIKNVADFKKRVVAHAIATGNSFAFHELFSRIREVPDITDESRVGPALLDHLEYLLPADDMAESPGFRSAMELVEKHGLQDNVLPAAILEETAKEAVARGRFAYAEEAYKLLGIKKEMVALYAQAGEQLLREDRAKHAAMSFFVAASLDQPIGPHYQYLGPELHSKCLAEPEKCLTALPIDLLIDAAIRFLFPGEALADRLMGSVKPEQKGRVLATLAVCRDLDLPTLVEGLRDAVAALSKIGNGQPDDYSPIGPMLLGRTTGTDEAWQYLREFCFEHPLGSLCVCVKMIRRTPVLVPVIRDGRSLIDLLLPPEFLDR